MSLGVPSDGGSLATLSEWLSFNPRNPSLFTQPFDSLRQCVVSNRYFWVPPTIFNFSKWCEIETMTKIHLDNGRWLKKKKIHLVQASKTPPGTFLISIASYWLWFYFSVLQFSLVVFRVIICIERRRLHPSTDPDGTNSNWENLRLWCSSPVRRAKWIPQRNSMVSRRTVVSNHLIDHSHTAISLLQL